MAGPFATVALSTPLFDLFPMSACCTIPSSPSVLNFRNSFYDFFAEDEEEKKDFL
jgi:hypothetical protein